jgi:hypothetical protein
MNLLVKAALALLLAPIVFSLLVELSVRLLLAVLPWLLLFGAISGATAGLTAALVLRRRLPPPRRTLIVPDAVRGEPIRRPRGRDREG